MTRLTRVRPRMDLSSRPRGQRSWPDLLSEYCLQVSGEFRPVRETRELPLETRGLVSN